MIEINDKSKIKILYKKENSEINNKDKINDCINLYHGDEIKNKEKYINDITKKIIEDKEEIK